MVTCMGHSKSSAPPCPPMPAGASATAAHPRGCDSAAAEPQKPRRRREHGLRTSLYVSRLWVCARHPAASRKRRSERAQSHHRRAGRDGRPCRGSSARLGRDRDHLRRTGSRLGRCARRRSGHARNRAAGAGRDGGRHRRHHARGRIRLRTRRRFRRAGLAEGTRPRFRRGRGAGADRAGRDPVRPVERRRQGLGPLPALP